MIVKPSVTRRQFVTTGLASLATISILPRRILGAPGQLSPNEQLTRAIIGTGGMGKGHIGYIPDVRLLALCDVDSNHLEPALERAGKDAVGYRDFREVLERKDIDIVHVPTPPHWHGLISIAAARAGKDIWCEKPMTRTIGEGIRVVEAVEANQRIFRLNTWFRFTDGFYGLGSDVKPVKKAVAAGMFGWPLKVTVSGHTGFDWKFNWSGRTDLEPMTVPDELNYDKWLGPAPYKPYHRHRVHATFRGYWDYDGGGLGDMGQHYLDPVQYILGKDHTSPVRIEADTDPQDADAVGSWRRITMTYADGCQIILDGENKDAQAAFIEGPEGKLMKGFKTNITGFEEKLRQAPEVEPQVTDFVEAVRNRRKFALNESNGHRSCTLVNLGKIALRLNRPLRFDPDKQVFIGDNDANALIHQPMRAPYDYSMVGG